MPCVSPHLFSGYVSTIAGTFDMGNNASRDAMMDQEYTGLGEESTMTV